MIDVAILTVSDAGFAGRREDVSGPALATRCRERNWRVVAAALLPDDASRISNQLREWADSGLASLILTTGGTGISDRDVTPEATREILERELPGVGELMRQAGLSQTPFSVLSRGVAGTRKQAFLVNLPGSPTGALHSLSAIEGLVGHVVALLAGRTEH